MKKNNKEILIKFNEQQNPNNLDDLICDFENKLNKINQKYYLKESENPFIYFLEFSNPNELMKKIKFDSNLSRKIEIIPVTCVSSNSNYVVSTILNKIRHKISYNDSFHIKCHITHAYENEEENTELDLSNQIKNIIKIKENPINPIWDINIYIIGDIAGINIKKYYYEENSIN